MENAKKQPPTYEQSSNEEAERREQESEQNDEPKTDVDKLMDELKRGKPEEQPSYDQL